MAAWIHLIFYSMISYSRGMLVILTDIKKWYWRFYGNFSYFWVNIDFVHLDSELQHGWMDSSDILQHDDLYLWDETCLHGTWNWRLYSCFSTFQLNIDFVHLNAGLLHGVFYYLNTGLHRWRNTVVLSSGEYVSAVILVFNLLLI